MKTIRLVRNLLMLGFLTANLQACKEDEVIIEPATPVITTNENEVPNGVTSINYAVQVIPVGQTGKVSGLTGAMVTIQHNGVTKTSTVDGSGIAVFSSLAPGEVSGHVTAAGFTTVNFTASLYADYINNDNNHTEYASSSVYVIKNNSGLSGRIYGDFDLDANNSVTQASNFQVVKLWITYSLSSYPMGSGNGKLTSVSLDTAAFTASSDVAGNFTFGGLPSTGSGFAAKLWMEDVKKQQASANYIFNFTPFTVTLNPGATTDIGDKEAQ